ncbi:DUF2460 domain-containing protein [Sphingomonas jatrophae]|uniref:TIGR02217 family protein n=1 Tax=Sphingomonas jatrophae TaxID=1166337 RepID=A0A1I6L3C9_9SPHN|nr:DUF2460 domain-containing protein [Sphingomonas jatrophae]SFR97995.1 TIGR02217 family protein [Sphingomonas jatrophae]
MGWRLATRDDALEQGTIKRFDARFWTVDFPRPMMAAATTIAPDALRVDLQFQQTGDLAGLIWEAEDRWDHPLLAYATDRDFSGCVLRFRWRSGGLMPLDAVNGPTLTIEGRDGGGAPRIWHVRLWNYAEGDPDDAAVTLDFDALDGGFLLPGEAERVWPADIDRLFMSLVALGHVPGGAEASPSEAWVSLSEIACDGAKSVLAIGEAMVPEHGLRIATGYDDCYNLTPARVLRQVLQLGYRGPINHYVGMSHYPRLDADGRATLTGGALSGPCAAWHRDFATRAKALDYGLIVSLSYELFDAYAPDAWKQRAADGSPALTGWVPPSTLLSPANEAAMSYLQAVAVAFVGIAVAAGHAPRFQIGEPWWWVMPDGRPCLYDEAARAAFGGSPPEIASVRAPLSPGEIALLDQAGEMLAASTGALRDAVRAAAPRAEVLLLVYLPTVLDRAAPELRRANVPVGWVRPAYDVLQLEDYDWTVAGDAAGTARGVAAMEARLGYPVSEQHLLSGFVLRAEDRRQWRAIAEAAEAARARGVAETFVWALPQVARDGFVAFDLREAAVDAFDEVDFPLALGREASAAPGFSTAIVTSAGGHEQRNTAWADARMRYDAGPGVRAQADIETLLAFFRARRGAAKAFRFRDPFDDSSAGMTGAPAATDQAIGTGDGVATGFPLVKRYGAGPEAAVRRITRPVAGSVRVALDGVQVGGWTLGPLGEIRFDVPPAAGVAVTAGYRFDVPVRFEEDRLEVNRATFLAGEAPSVPLVEVRE